MEFSLLLLHPPSKRAWAYFSYKKGCSALPILWTEMYSKWLRTIFFIFDWSYFGLVFKTSLSVFLRERFTERERKTYLEHFREESGADLFAVEIVESIQIGDGMTKGLTRWDGTGWAPRAPAAWWLRHRLYGLQSVRICIDGNEKVMNSFSRGR